MTGDSQLRFVDEKHLLGGPDPAVIYTTHVLPEKIAIDLAYARSHSLGGDVRILARTLALPFALALDRVRARQGILRVWFRAATSASLLALVFVLAASRLP